MSVFDTQRLPKVTIIKGDTDYSLISLNTYDINNESIEIKLILVIDISGSMSGIRLDLVLHAIKVIINASNENVEIAIFTFDSIVRKITDFTPLHI
jgi:predicted metal-dependent peptidase